MGDGLYAVFGLNTDVRPSAPAAVRSGYDILKNLEQMNFIISSNFEING
jgi:hypothetical protein